jgi:hypothetical protein
LKLQIAHFLPTNPSFLARPKVGYRVHASILCTSAESDGFAGPIFHLQTFTKKNKGHNILWSAIYSILKDSLQIALSNPPKN